jgi:hypothetical protein
VLLALLLLPAGVVIVVDVLAHPGRLATYRLAGEAMLEVYLPYGALVLLALAGYLTLSWRHRFLASALLLGPLTLLRPLVAAAGAATACWASHDVAVSLVALVAMGAALLIEPLVGRTYARQQAAVARVASSAGPSRRWRG